MRLPSRGRSYGVAFDITPLIDIVFLLIIFFLVAANFAGRESQLVVDLPNISETEEYAPLSNRLVVTIDGDFQLYVADELVDILRVESILQDDAAADPANYEVQIRGDATTPYSVIEPIMLLCARYGVTRVGFKVHQAAELVN